MPEMQFRVAWPDATETTHYSPSLVVESHLSPNQSYGLSDFVTRTASALETASERVRARFGMPCPRALAARDDIARRAATFEAGEVTVVSFQRL